MSYVFSSTRTCSSDKGVETIKPKSLDLCLSDVFAAAGKADGVDNKLLSLRKYVINRLSHFAFISYMSLVRFANNVPRAIKN